MTELYTEETRLEAWVRSTKSIMEDDYKQDVVLHIESPDSSHKSTSRVTDSLDRHYASADMDPIQTVAEWIFPGWLYLEGGIEHVFNEYPKQLEIIESKDSAYHWGTYFGRMIERVDPKTGETYNPLQKTIEKLKRANKKSGQGFHACYELELFDSSYDISTYNSNTDRNLVRNLPCLSHLSFKLYEGKVHLTAMYRSHDYRFKTLGNLLGLARLLTCVAQETKADIGQLVIHSSRAFLSSSAGKPEFKKLVDRESSELNNQSLVDFY